MVRITLLSLKLFHCLIYCALLPQVFNFQHILVSFNSLVPCNVYILNFMSFDTLDSFQANALFQCHSSIVWQPIAFYYYYYYYYYYYHHFIIIIIIIIFLNGARSYNFGFRPISIVYKFLLFIFYSDFDFFFFFVCFYLSGNIFYSN